MASNGLDWIVLSFSFFSSLRMASYLLQIVALIRDRNGATAISLSCWTIWVGANASTGLYAWVHLSDIGLAAVSAFNATCCTIVLGLAAFKRITHEGRKIRPPSVTVSFPSKFRQTAFESVSR